MASVARVTASVAVVALVLSLPAVLQSLLQTGEVALPFYWLVALAVVVLVPGVLVRSFTGSAGSASLGVLLGLLYVLAVVDLRYYVGLWEPMTTLVSFAVPEPALGLVVLVLAFCAASGAVGHLLGPRAAVPEVEVRPPPEAPPEQAPAEPEVKAPEPSPPSTGPEEETKPAAAEPELGAPPEVGEETMSCPDCSAEIPKDAKFCPYCGRRF